jgi:hypothetical protein
MANRHFGKLADVWKHLVLAEVLTVDRPRRFYDTHAGHAVYAMTVDLERRYGVVNFIDVAARQATLAASNYFRVLRQQMGGRDELTEYPAGPMIAMRQLGKECDYCFCDLDPESTANIRTMAVALAVESQVRVVAGDGMTAVHNALKGLADVKRTVVYIDPFDHLAVGPGGLSALEVAREAADLGAAVVYWYGYNRPDQRGWIFNLLCDLAPAARWWCGDIMVTATDADMSSGDLGAATSPGTGFGLACANVSSPALIRCDNLGVALAQAYQGRPLPDGRVGGLSYKTWTAELAIPVP